MRCVIVSDSHLRPPGVESGGKRQGDLALILLQRLVHRINRFICPDAVAFLGDLIDDPESADAPQLYGELRSVLDQLEVPWLVLPGNHDLPSEQFYQCFPRPPTCWDVKGVRFLPFIDPEEPGYNARREPHDLCRMRAARADGWNGPVVALQHVPVYPSGKADCPYNYVNADEVLGEMRRQGIGLALSGHYHEGFDLLREEGLATLAAPAVCEQPFPYLIVTIARNDVAVERQTLSMPPEWQLRDTHLHTPFAYCNDNMTMPMAQRLCRAFGLQQPVFTEHSGHLYFPREHYPKVCCRNGIEVAEPQHDRFNSYLHALESHRVDPALRGIEIDADSQGQAIIRKQHLAAVPFRVGAVHHLDCLSDPTCTDARAADAYLGLLERFLKHGFQVLAHPFRVFGRAGRAVPAGIEEPVVELLRNSHTAAEINVHTHNPTPEWIARCINNGVRLAFGSDAHSLYEVGDFLPHIQLLRQAGISGNPANLLIDWP